MDTALTLRMKLVAWASMLGFGAAWGTTIPLSKIAVSTGHPPMGLIFWQLVVVALVLSVVFVVRKRPPTFNASMMKYYFFIALLGTLIPNNISYLAIRELPAGVMAISIATVPMFTLAIALAAGLERLSLNRLAGILIGFAAMAMLALPESSLPLPGQSLWVIFAFIAPLAYAAEANFVATSTPANAGPVSTLFFASILGAVLMAPLAAGTGNFIVPIYVWSGPEWALVLSSAIHAVTYCGYIWLVNYAGPVFSVQMAYPVTLSGIFFSIMFLGESYSGWIWAALITVIIGLALVQPKTAEPVYPETS